MSPNFYPGARLGHFEIKSQLGAGRMGEVYLAENTRLHRKVALKILRAEMAGNQDRMRRFKQEATAAAALNHPNIAHIHESGESDRTNFIADGARPCEKRSTAKKVV
jgi:serine/threonine-protein kinase